MSILESPQNAQLIFASAELFLHNVRAPNLELDARPGRLTIGSNPTPLLHDMSEIHHYEKKLNGGIRRKFFCCSFCSILSYLRNVSGSQNIWLDWSLRYRKYS